MPTGPIMISTGETTSRIDRELSLYVDPIKVQKFYSLFLWNLESNAVHVDSKVDTRGLNANAEYFFTTPPKALEISEPFNSNIVRTQTGGAFVEGYGSLIKDINIEGTTGLRPKKFVESNTTTTTNRSRSGDSPTRSVSLVPTLETILENETTGHDSAITLRNLFRSYSDSQENGEAQLVMVWRNIKDDDYWIVEPTMFRLSQNSSSPLTYNYAIQLKTIARFDSALAPVEYDAQESINSPESASRRSAALSQSATFTFYDALNYADDNAKRLILGPLKRVIYAVGAAHSGVFGAVTDLTQAAEDALFAVDSVLEYYKFLGAPDDPRSATGNFKRSLQRFAATVKEMMRDNKRLEDDTLPNASQAYSRTKVPYNKPNLNSGTPLAPVTGGSSSFIGNASTPTNTGTSVVGPTDDIYSLSRKLLGDAKRWQELVLINKLKSPYISIATREATLNPGDIILFPIPGNKPGSTMISTGQKAGQDYDDAQEGLQGTNLSDLAYGRDIRLRSVVGDFDASMDLTDLSPNQRGDISTIVGAANVQQAIRIKFMTEKGELRAHPFFGAKFPIGSKATINSFNDFRINTLATLASDPRIDNVSNLKFLSTGDIISVSADILLINATASMGTNFTLRRF